MKTIATLVFTVYLMLVLSAIATSVPAADYGQWDRSNPIVQWYKTLMQPDNPAVSCCGESDAYWADEFEQTKDGLYVAIITDTREDGPLGREHVPPGTRIVVPNHKIKHDQGNPTGHGIIFLAQAVPPSTPHGNRLVYCYLPPSGL